MNLITLWLAGLRHSGKQTFIMLTIVKIQCDQWPLMMCGGVFAVPSNAFAFGHVQKLSDATFLLANVSYAIWSSSQEGVSFNIFPSTHFWLTQNTKISKFLVCQEVSSPGLIDCQYFKNDWSENLMWYSMSFSVALDFSTYNFTPFQNYYFWIF